MARNQKNFSYFKYVDDNAAEWNVRGEDGGPGGTVDGHATDYALPVWGAQTVRRHVRYALWQDALFRTKRIIVYTPTAFAAIGPGDTLDFPVEGLATNVTYTFAGKIAEKQPAPKASRHLADT